ncbi:MAG: hypothetical protein IT303_16735 [Dehalococcoidia bacterium]|nr:hypothetical protein [Dehalococcoidia bacterium]
MSQLQKKIQKIQRREGPALGFGPKVREQPRAVLLGVVAADAAAATAAADAGADVVILQAADAAGAAAAVKKAARKELALGVQLASLDEAGAAALREAGCDFVVSTLEGTASAAVDTEAMGQVIVASEAMEDNTLRALAPLGLDGLLVERAAGAMTLAQQLGLVRLASFAGTPLIVSVTGEASVSELRVLRDSGVGVALLPAGSAASAIEALDKNLRAVPAPKKGRAEGRELAIVPSVSQGGHDHDDDDSGE